MKSPESHPAVRARQALDVLYEGTRVQTVQEYGSRRKSGETYGLTHLERAAADNAKLYRGPGGPAYGDEV